MALKDPTLDARIVEASRAEFLQYGYRKASLRNIAERAGITTGALYTRYPSKDALFCDLVTDFLTTIKQEAATLQKPYAQALEKKDVDSIIGAIRNEQEYYMSLLQHYYDDCVLFLARSEGSSAHHLLDQMEEDQVQLIVSFFDHVAQHDFDRNGVMFVAREQFRSYARVLQSGYSKERALQCMQTMNEFLESGWKTLLSELM